MHADIGEAHRQTGHTHTHARTHCGFSVSQFAATPMQRVRGFEPRFSLIGNWFATSVLKARNAAPKTTEMQT